MKITQKKLNVLMEIYKPKNYDMYIFGLAKNLDITYSQLCKIIREYEQLKILTLTDYGRMKIIKLTASGIFVCSRLKEILAVLDGNPKTKV